MSKVIDMKTREPFRIEQHRPASDEQRVAMFIDGCRDVMFMNAVKLRAVGGLDLALRALHQLADDIKKYGRE